MNIRHTMGLSMTVKRWRAPGAAVLSALILTSAAATAAVAATATASASASHPEYNPAPTRPVAAGPEAGRLIVGFRVGSGTVVQTIHSQQRGTSVRIDQARTDAGDVAALARRAHVTIATSRQLTPSMHVLRLPKVLYGADVAATLAALRADPAVAFAAVDQRRYPHATIPDDPLFQLSATASGQWFMLTPSTATPASDAAATDVVSAWDITKGSSGTVIADVDTGVLFEHPDLLRAGFGGRLLPGYDFVSQDLNRTNGTPLGTSLIANDGDGWDPDPSDPGDWINAADQTNALFPSSDCPTGSSSWHGTRVMGILGALTDNGTGVAGMTWNGYLLPVRALGKCGGYDSDIIVAMQWAAGLSITGVPDNPYPADIINLSLGGTGSCASSAYPQVIATLTTMGVLVVASAGNENGPVDSPANCSGVLGVAGLRNVGTKVGYSSLGSEVGIAAPAGNCVTTSGACLRSLDTTTNAGTTVAAADTYTDQLNANLGTSFSAPIVSGIAALMRSVNANLTPLQLIARLKSSATPFPQPAGVPACPAVDSNGSGVECRCATNGTQCGAGMVNALAAVTAAQRPIAAVAVPANGGVGNSVVVDAGGSAASCGRTLASYAWTASPGNLITSGANTARVTVTPSGASGTLTLTVTDSSGAIDTVQLPVAAGGAITKPSTTPASAGTAACPAALTVSPAAPTVTEAFSPASVGENAAATLTITLHNANPFVLTQAAFTESLPAGLSLSAAAPATTCPAGSITQTTGGVALRGADIPANGSCTVTLAVQSPTPGSYTNSIAPNALTTGPAGANTQGATALLTVTAPASGSASASVSGSAASSGKGGGGEMDWWDGLFAVGVLLAGRRHVKRGPRR